RTARNLRQVRILILLKRTSTGMTWVAKRILVSGEMSTQADPSQVVARLIVILDTTYCWDRGRPARK
ncbi:MAG TPA: hypothetical protein VHR36_03185, partial [Pyrinomonadaceae bacterium]|nr:hypothetical protein [Pyrinomonadaceae bacterium]